MRDTKAAVLQFERLLNIMDDLRTQCPWDKKQTIHSIAPLTLEEIYELLDGIKSEDWNEIKEELGDVLLHLIFYARIAEEESKFAIEDVMNTIAEKMIRRHPHIYGDVKVENEEDVKRNWQKIKLQNEHRSSVLDGVPKTMPALLKAKRIQQKVNQIGLTPDIYGDKSNNIGDQLFDLVSQYESQHIDLEESLEETNHKFIARFKALEKNVTQAGKQLSELTKEEWKSYWASSNID